MEASADRPTQKNPNTQRTPYWLDPSFDWTVLSLHQMQHIFLSSIRSFFNMGVQGAHPSTQMSSHAQLTPYLSYYENECRVNPDLGSFDSNLQRRTSQVINTLAEGVKAGSLPMESLRELTDWFSDSSQKAVKLILEYNKNDILDNKDLVDLVEDYLENSLQTLEFCNALENFLNRARESQLMIEAALLKFEREQREVFDGKTREIYSRTLEKLNNFKTAGDPFTAEFLSFFQTVHEKQKLMLDELKAKKIKLDKKLKSVKAVRTVWNVIFAATCATVLICSAVAAVAAAPGVVIALAVMTSASPPIGKWIDSLWDKYENEVEGHCEIMGTMESGTRTTITELETIRLHVDRLKIVIESMLRNAGFALREKEEDAVMLAIDDIKLKLCGFKQTIDNLHKQTYKCRCDIDSGRTEILEKIIKHPNN